MNEVITNNFDGINLAILVAAVAIIVLLVMLIRHDQAKVDHDRNKFEAAKVAARGEILSEVSKVADEYEPISRDAIRSAVWTVEQRNRVRAASCAVCAQEE
jgi:ABC-type anion transport system duplicated permease subunit